MRIAFCAPHSDPLAEPGEPDSGGQCVYEQRLSASLAAIDAPTRTYTRRWGGKEPHRIIRDGAEMLRIDAGGGAFVPKEEMAAHIPTFVDEMWRRDAAWLDGAEVFHGHYWDGGVAALYAATRAGKPLVFTSHSLGREKRDRVPEDGSLHYHIRIPAEQRVMAAADRIIALSEMEKGVLGRRYGVDPAKVAVVPGGVDTEVYRPTGDPAAVRGELGVGEEERLVFTTGRLDPRKGYDLLLEAIPAVRRRLEAEGVKARFLLPGGGDQLNDNERAVRERMGDLIARHGLEDWVILFPHLSFDRLLAYYSAADIYVLPSPYEPFGLVAVEAFACGTPVLATCHGGPPEIVDEGENGGLADPNEPDAFGAALADYLRDTERLRTMGQNGLEKARAVFDWRAVARSIHAVYGEAAQAMPR